MGCRPSWRLCQARMLRLRRAIVTAGCCLSAGMPSCEVTCPSGRELQRLPDFAHGMCSFAGIRSKGKRQTEASTLIASLSLHSSLCAGYECDVCSKDIPDGKRFFDCRKCDFSMCIASSPHVKDRPYERWGIGARPERCHKKAESSAMAEEEAK